MATKVDNSVFQVLDGKGAKYVVETMWMLMEAGLEEVSSTLQLPDFKASKLSVQYIETLSGEAAADADPVDHHQRCLSRRLSRSLSGHLL